MTERKTPQEKKRLSYSCDRRNDYGENAKSSRKNIPLSKAKSIRQERHEQEQGLRLTYRATSEDQLVEAELAVVNAKPRWWRKAPDAPLGSVVEAKLERRR